MALNTFTIPEDSKQQVRDLHAQGLAPAEIRRQTGLSFTSIRRITLPHAEPKPPPGRWRKYYDKDKSLERNTNIRILYQPRPNFPGCDALSGVRRTF